MVIISCFSRLVSEGLVQTIFKQNIDQFALLALWDSFMVLVCLSPIQFF